MNTNPLDNQLEMMNTSVIANMIEVAVEVLCKIEPDLIEVGNSEEAKVDLAEGIGASVFAEIIKEAGVAAC